MSAPRGAGFPACGLRELSSSLSEQCEDALRVWREALNFSTERNTQNRVSEGEMLNMSRFRVADLGRNLLFALTLTLVVVGDSGCSRSTPRRKRWVDRLALMKTILGMYQVDNGRYPTTAEGLGALLTKPSDLSITNWHGPYLEKASDLKDSWGHEYTYRCPGLHNPNGYDLHSMGPDGEDNTLDDIVNWPVSDK
jgi:type II secretion system protein G